MKSQSFFKELKRRNVYRVAVAYLVSSWLILQVASILLPTFEASNWFMKVIIYFLLAGFPVSLIFAWIFELTPEGLKKTDEIAENTSYTRQTGQKLNRVIIGVLSLVIVILLVERFIPSTSSLNSPTNTELNSIAVFPFEVRGNAELQYLGEGMVDLISTKLDGIPGMNSIDPYIILAKARDNSLSHQDPPAYARIASQLGAQEFLLGSIIDLGDKIQFSASKYSDRGKLVLKTQIETSNTQSLSGTIDQLVFELISEEFKQKGQEFSSLAALTTEDFNALKHFLEGESHYRSGDFIDAIHHYDQAIKIDSTFAQAWIKLDDALSWRTAERRNFDTDAIRAAIKKYANTLPEKWRDYLKAIEMFDYRMMGAQSEFKRLIDRYGPSYNLLNGLAETIFHNGVFYGQPYWEAEPYLKQAIEYDPDNHEAYIHLADIAFGKKDTIALKSYRDDQVQNSSIWQYIRHKRILLGKDLNSQLALEYISEENTQNNEVRSAVKQFADSKDFFDTVAMAVGLMPESQRKMDLEGFFMAMQGKEQDYVGNFSELNERLDPNIINLNLAFAASTYISDPSFAPLIEMYPEFISNLDSLRPEWFPQLSFRDFSPIFKNNVQGRLCLAIGDLDCYQRNLKDLQINHPDELVNRLIQSTRLGLLATETILKGDVAKAKSYVDSIWRIDILHRDLSGLKVSAMSGNLITMAQFCELEGNYDAAIRFYQQKLFADMTSFSGIYFGYSQYKQAQMYELKGDKQKAIEFYDRFMAYYEDCDEKYKPWVDDAKARRENLFRSTL